MFGHNKKNTNLLGARAFSHKRGGFFGWLTGDKHVGWKRWVWLFGMIVVTVVVTVVIMALPFAISALDGYRQALAGRSSLVAAEEAIQQLNLPAAATDASQAVQHFTAMRDDLQRLKLIAWLPGLGEKVRVALLAADSGVEAATAASDLLSIGREMSDVLSQSAGLPSTGATSIQPGLVQDLSPAARRRLLASMADNAAALHEASDRVNAALAAFDKLALEPSVSGFLGQLTTIRGKLEMLQSALKTVSPLTEIVPRALGYPQQKNYLVIFQNNTELRPTGGFLSMVGIASLQDGSLTTPLDMEDVYAYDAPAERTERPAAPAPIQKYLGVEHLYLRDANWSPDFPTASKDIIRVFSDEYAARFNRSAPHIDGVIAVTPRPAQDLLRLVGPIKIGTRQFDADNLVDELEFQVEMGYTKAGVAKEDRKDVVGELARQVEERVRGFKIPQALALAGIMEKNLASGDIQFYSTDADVQAMIAARDWGGQLRAVDDDYVAVVDANLASLKTDAVMKRSVVYSISPDASGALIGRVAITYENRGVFSWKQTRYRVG